MKTPSTRSAEATARALSRKLKAAGFPKADISRFGFWYPGFEVERIIGTNIVRVEHIPERGIPDADRQAKRTVERQRLQEWLTGAGYPVTVTEKGELHIECETK